MRSVCIELFRSASYFFRRIHTSAACSCIGRMQSVACKLAESFTTESFLRNLQIHVYRGIWGHIFLVYVVQHFEASKSCSFHIRVHMEMYTKYFSSVMHRLHVILSWNYWVPLQSSGIVCFVRYTYVHTRIPQSHGKTLDFIGTLENNIRIPYFLKKHHILNYKRYGYLHT